MASAAARVARAPKVVEDRIVEQRPKADDSASDVQVIVRELAAVADYIGHMKKEIAALKPNELCRDGIPSANDELGNVVQATASATHTIMEAAEEILGSSGLSDKDYRSLVETNVLAIFEACSFQDITGQRIAKVVETLQHIETRVARFADVMRAKDLDGFLDDAERARIERKEKLMIHGPQLEGAGNAQNQIDELFA